MYSVDFLSIACYLVLLDGFNRQCSKLTPLQLVLELFGLLSSFLSKTAENVGLALDLITLRRGQTPLLKDALQSREFLGNKIVALAQLVKDADVVLSIGVLGVIIELLHSLRGFSGNVFQLSTAGKLGDQRVQSGNGSSKTVKTATSNTVSTGLLVDELDEILLGAAARVLLALLVASTEPLDGWVGRNALLLGDGLAVRSFGVNLGNDNLGLVGKVSSERLPRRSQILAV